jgi:PAS domain S-box-containing protein
MGTIIKHALQLRRIELEQQTTEPGNSRNAVRRARQRYEVLYNRYANLFELSPNAYVVFDQTGSICEANLNAAIMFNLPKGELIGSPVARFIHGDDQETFDLLKQDCHQSCSPHTAELKMIQSDGKHFPAQIQLLLLPSSHQSGNEFRASLVDLSETVRHSAHLHFLHQCLESAVKATNTQQLLEDYIQQIKEYAGCAAVGIRLLDDSGRIPYQAYDGFSRQFCESESPLSLHSDQCMCIEVIKGYVDASRSFFTSFGSFYVNAGSRFLSSMPLEERGRTRNACNAAGFESVALIPIFIDRTISGLIHVADRRENLFPLRVVEVLEQAAMRLGLALQRFHMQEKLSDAVVNLRELSSHLLKVKEAEQRRIAMELHDQTGQDLNVLKLRLKEIENRLRRDQEPLKQFCTDTRAYTDTIIDNLRRMTSGLNPAVLETLGLMAALKELIREFSEHSPMGIATHIEPLKTITDRDTQVGLYRIIQEALNNACKHATATQLSITAIKTGKGVHVTIEDNGLGFITQRVPRYKCGPKGMGMQTMRLRARMLDGNLSVQSKPGHGTRITINLPIKSAREVP